MNEVKSDLEAVVRRIHVENAQPVEFGQLLFELEPLTGRPLDAADALGPRSSVARVPASPTALPRAPALSARRAGARVRPLDRRGCEAA